MKDTYDFSAAKRGAVAPAKGKTRITIMLDDAVLEAARQRADAQGMGYQTLINAILKQALCGVESNPDDSALNEILNTLRSLVEGQAALAAKLDTSADIPSGHLNSYSRQKRSVMAAREEPGPLEAAIKKKAKAAGRKHSSIES
ncbi:MAG TPA: BrnA antitoxin family protein [Methylophilaceae bacterium]|nr:BrnA antitoxin family protein [Methylophilaceae bacterium]